MRIFYTTIIISTLALAFVRCGSESKTTPLFTKADTLTDYYLKLQDTLHMRWNMMIHQDNKKVRAMSNLLHELRITGQRDVELLASFEERVDQLFRMRYTPKSMCNGDVVKEYDFATNSLIRELIALAESRREYAYNVTLQKLVDDILASDQRILASRHKYDSVARLYNRFLERNHRQLMDANLSPEKKPLFQAIAAE